MLARICLISVFDLQNVKQNNHRFRNIPSKTNQPENQLIVTLDQKSKENHIGSNNRNTVKPFRHGELETKTQLSAELNNQKTQILKRYRYASCSSGTKIKTKQKVRIMPKIPQRKISSNLSIYSLDNKPRDSFKVTQPKIKFLTESQESLLAQYNSPSAKVAFEEKHKELYLRIVKQSKQNAAKKVDSVKSYTEELKRQIKKSNKQKVTQQSYFKTKYDEVNRRMEDIMKNWKKSKKSINERYYELWIKPNSHKSNVSNANLDQSQNYSGKTISLK